MNAGGIRISLVLPLEADSPAPATNYFDFLCGALTASENAAAEGIDVNLNVVDFSDFGGNNSEIDDAVTKSDLIVGPVTYSQMRTFQNISRRHRIPIVSPLDPSTADYASANEYFFQVPAPHEVQIANLVKMLEEDGEGPVTIFYSASDTRLKEEFEAALQKESIPYRTKTYDVLHGRDITETLHGELFADTTAVLYKALIASEDVAFASDVVRNLGLLKREGVPVTIYGTNRLRSFKTIDLSNLYALRLRVATPFYVDYDDEATKAFVISYREKYNTEPTPYAFQGYDILTYFIARLNDLGSSMTDYISYYPATGLQNEFRFERLKNDDGEDEGGFINAATRSIRYDKAGL